MDKIFGHLSPTDVKNVRQVSSFMRKVSFPTFHLVCPIDIMKRIENPYFSSWTHMMDHRNLVVHTRCAKFLGAVAEGRFKQLFGSGNIRRLKLIGSERDDQDSWIMKEMMNAFKNLEGLDIELLRIKGTPEKEGPEGQKTWIWPICEKLKWVTFRSSIPQLKQFMEATPKIVTVDLGANFDKSMNEQLMRLLKGEEEEEEEGGPVTTKTDIWPRLKSFTSSYDITVRQLLESLGSRPIRRLQLRKVEYSALHTFVELLKKYGEILEWVEVHVALHRRPYVQGGFELPSNLKRLKGWKFSLYDPNLLPERPIASCFGRNRCETCAIRMVMDGMGFRYNDGSRGASRDFFNFGRMLRDYPLFRERFPELRYLSLLLYPSSLGPQLCHSCITDKHLACNSLVPQRTLNPDLRVVEISHPTQKEDPQLYATWRKKLGRMFPSATIVDCG